MVYPEILQKLIHYYKKLPGIGEKTAERLALATIEFEEEDIENFSDVLLLAKNDLRRCKICGHLSDDELCLICQNKTRDNNLICIIDDYKSVYAFEKAGNYNGVYHVLNGLISPVNGIYTEHLNLDKLEKRIENLINPEFLIALKSSIEGETTTLYIKKMFEKKDVVISRLSYGIPLGAEIEYLDILTLDKAIEDRKKISE